MYVCLYCESYGPAYMWICTCMFIKSMYGMCAFALFIKRACVWVECMSVALWLMCVFMCPSTWLYASMHVCVCTRPCVLGGLKCLWRNGNHDIVLTGCLESDALSEWQGRHWWGSSYCELLEQVLAWSLCSPLTRLSSRSPIQKHPPPPHHYTAA